MTEFINFLLLCARYISFWEFVFKQPTDSAKEFDRLYNELAVAENDLFMYAAIYRVYSTYNEDQTLNLIRKVFTTMKPTVIDCRIIPPQKNWSDPLIHSSQAQHQATVLGDMSDGQTLVLFRYFTDELTFTPSELIGLTQDEAVELFHKKDIEYLRS